jgi:hypothetical protein
MSYQQHIRIWLSDVKFTKFLVSLLDSIFIQYQTKVILAIFPDTSNKSQIKLMTTCSVSNDIFVSGQVMYYVQSC